ncbi:hypothetical protein [Streptomyces sp. NPDC046979]|uniref:hypothetical protein n=1 Tax=Streptomyces sp. NPDC046979 TaxID=3154604 RepID=UPI0033DB398F
MSRLVCSECGEAAQQVSPSDWIGAWGPAPKWSHTDGSSLCPEMGLNGYQPCQPEVV